eukprot:893529_1
MNSQRNVNYQHHSVELQCPSTQHSITIQLPSTGDSPNWTVNLNCIINTISNQFTLVSNLNELEWLLTSNDMMMNRHDPIQFGALLSKQIPPPAILKIISLKSIAVLKNSPKQTVLGLVNEILDDMTPEERRSLNGHSSDYQQRSYHISVNIERNTEILFLNNIYIIHYLIIL